MFSDRFFPTRKFLMERVIYYPPTGTLCLGPCSSRSRFWTGTASMLAPQRFVFFAMRNRKPHRKSEILNFYTKGKKHEMFESICFESLEVPPCALPLRFAVINFCQLFLSISGLIGGLAMRLRSSWRAQKYCSVSDRINCDCHRTFRFCGILKI